MSVANIQTPAGITFNERKVSAVLLSGTTTIAAKMTVKIDSASLIAATPAVKVSLLESNDIVGGALYGVVTKEITAAKAGIVQLGGIATATAGATIAVGSPLMTDGTTGELKLATDAKDICVAVALEGGTDGNDMKVMLVDGPAYAGTDVS